MGTLQWGPRGRIPCPSVLFQQHPFSFWAMPSRCINAEGVARDLTVTQHGCAGRCRDTGGRVSEVGGKLGSSPLVLQHGPWPLLYQGIHDTKQNRNLEWKEMLGSSACPGIAVNTEGHWWADLPSDTGEVVVSRLGSLRCLDMCISSGLSTLL